MRLFVARYLAGAIFCSVLLVPQQAIAHLFEKGDWVAQSFYMMPQKSNSSIGIGGLGLQSNLYLSSTIFRPSQEKSLVLNSASLNFSPMSVNFVDIFQTNLQDTDFKLQDIDASLYLFGSMESVPFLRTNQAIFFTDLRKF